MKVGVNALKVLTRLLSKRLFDTVLKSSLSLNRDFDIGAIFCLQPPDLSTDRSIN